MKITRTRVIDNWEQHRQSMVNRQDNVQGPGATHRKGRLGCLEADFVLL